MKSFEEENITCGLPHGFEIRMGYLERSPRQFKLYKDDVWVASGQEWDNDYRQDRGEWFLCYYAAPETKGALDAIMADFREYKDRERSLRSRECLEKSAVKRDAERSAALKVLGDFINKR